MPFQKILQTLLGLCLFVVVSLAVAGASFVVGSVSELKSQLEAVNAIKDDQLPLSSEVFDRSGAKIGEFASERRYFAKLKDLPEHVVNAFFSAEDKDFRQHFGVSPKAIVRSLLANVRGGRIRQGASTITQQLARLYFLSSERTWDRKVKEAVLAIAIENKLTKDQILELYLNKIYFGNRSYGIEAASRNYFRKNASDLSVGEAALLAGLPKSPSGYAPNRHPERASRRQLVVLKRMEEDGFIQKGDAEAWAKAVLHVLPNAEDFSTDAPYFVAEVQRELAKKFEFGRLPQGGLRVYTTLDAGLQKAADSRLALAIAKAKKEAQSGFKRRARIEAALYGIDPNTGAVRVMQGGGSFAETQFNRAAATKRRLGGLFLPLYVSLALERGFTAMSNVGDDPMSGRRLGADAPTPTLYDAVLKGMTIETTPLYTALGNGSVLEHARNLGFSFDRDDLTVALGYGEASPAQVAVAYASFANGGRVVSPYMVERVEDLNGKVLYKANPKATAGAPVLSPANAFIMNQLLQDTVALGHADRAKGAAPLAGGMSAATDDFHDAWFVGLTPNLTTALWIGAETGDVRLADTEQRAQDIAEEAWADFMRAAPKRFVTNAKPVQVPENVSFARQGRRSIPFVAGTEPTSETRRF